MNDINFTMYKLAGIIAEYDPFHNGHAWQLQQAKALGAQRVAVAMSCGLTQRGALPLLPESVRVQAALTCGADLVFALPAPYACSGAECFARAGVQLLAAAGCDALVFGAETPDAALLMEAARVLSGAEYRTALKARLAAGARSFAAARQAAVEAVCPGTGLAALLDKPNNNLAVEYCKAILELGAALVPIPLPRQGAGHGQALTETGGGSLPVPAPCARSGRTAERMPLLPMFRRKSCRSTGKPLPPGSTPIFAAAQRCQLALLRSRCAGTAPFAQVRGISEGLEHRLEAAVRSSTTHAELLDSLTTVRYPRARMRRLAMDAALDYSADAFPALPPYLHLLGAQKDALPLLKAAALPVSHSLARLAEQNAPCRAVVDAQLRACDFGALCRKKPEPMGGVLRQKIIFLTK